jgi:hypothetical protein
VGVALCDIEYVREPCGFVVTTRHSPTKLSWHVTLSVLGTYHTLRVAVSQAVRFASHLPMAKWLDPCILNNAKGQFIQPIGSQKVSAAAPAEDHRFAFVGAYRAGGSCIKLPSQGWEFMASSLAMPDTISQRANPQWMGPLSAVARAKRPRPVSSCSPSSSAMTRDDIPEVLALTPWPPFSPA